MKKRTMIFYSILCIRENGDTARGFYFKVKKEQVPYRLNKYGSLLIGMDTKILELRLIHENL